MTVRRVPELRAEMPYGVPPIKVTTARSTHRRFWTKLVLAVLALFSFAWLWSWEAAIIVIFGISIHEYGHLWAMRRCGIPTKGAYFLPFLGAVIRPDRPFQTRQEEAYVALMGPLFGFFPAAFLLLVWSITGHGWDTLAAGAYVLAGINLVNFLPVMPLDGGRIARSLVFSINRTLGIIVFVAGIALAAFIAFHAASPIWVMVAIFAGLELCAELSREEPIVPMTGKQMLVMLFGIILTAGSLSATFYIAGGAFGIQETVTRIMGG